MDLTQHLLRTGLRHFISAPTSELAQDEVARVTGQPIDPAAFADAVAALLRDGLIRDPIRLEDQALQCHWRLELTPKGVALARSLAGA
ncbi:MAG: hypothetical protein IT556_00065 [Acetobacteraceae bacterium]|nr:hypothetical protein [Acetobacteraceae bacterium]